MYFDRNWEQTTEAEAYYYRYVSIDSSGEFRFHVQDFYPDGVTQMTGTYRSIRPDNKDGHFIYYYESGQKQMSCDYRNDKLHGPMEEWYESGAKESYQEFSEGLPDGQYTSWREDGSMKLNAKYHRGTKHGHFQSFYPNGQMVRNDYFENDRLLEGKCYSPEGDEIDYFPYVQMPEYPGGRSALYSFVEKELKYPSEAKKQGREGAVLVLFTIDEEGYVNDPRVVNGDRDYFNQEALRLVKKFPQWIPGKIDGTASPIQVSVPIEFRLR
jgi:TonB family protein